MKRSAAAMAVVVAVAICLATAGCGRDGPELGSVTGTVTLDGTPLPGARVEFQPQARETSPSYATTDAAGHYELIYGIDQYGAMPGQHAVRITTFAQHNDGEGMAKMVPERVPPRYNAETELIKEVESGDNTIDFPLEGALTEPVDPSEFD